MNADWSEKPKYCRICYDGPPEWPLCEWHAAALGYQIVENSNSDFKLEQTETEE